MDEDYLDQVLSDYNQLKLEGKKPFLQMIEANQAKMVELQTEKQRLIDAYTAGVLSLDDIAAKKTALDKNIQNLNDAIIELQAELGPNGLSEEETNLIHFYAKKIRNGLYKADEN